MLLSRIDSDDAFERTAMARIRDSYEQDPSGPAVLIFQVGYRLDYTTARLGLFFHYSPSCCTVVHRQPIGDPLDQGGKHFKLPDLYPFRAIDGGQPMFLQAVHGQNIATDLWQIQLSPQWVSAHILSVAFNIDAARLLEVCWHQPLERMLRPLGPSDRRPRRRR